MKQLYEVGHVRIKLLNKLAGPRPEELTVSIPFTFVTTYTPRQTHSEPRTSPVTPSCQLTGAVAMPSSFQTTATCSFTLIGLCSTRAPWLHRAEAVQLTRHVHSLAHA